MIGDEVLLVKKRNGRLEELNLDKINKCIERACSNLDSVSVSEIALDAHVQLYNKVTTLEIDRALILCAKSKIEKDPNYSYVAARLLSNTIYKEVFGEGIDSDTFELQYRKSFISNLKKLAKAGRIDEKLLDFNLKDLSDYISVDRDLKFKYLGIQTLYDRYFIHIDGRRMEAPQSFWMRVAMGLSINEDNKNEMAKKFYDVMSNMYYSPSTPTLFNSGTCFSQLSSCYLSTVDDSIDGIFGTIHNQARLSKYAGGLGVDWTPIRAANAYIAGTNGNSNGLIPWLKIFNDTLVAVNQCFAPDTIIYTSNGIKKIKDITESDFVINSKGEYSKVKSVLKYEQTDPMVEIEVEGNSNSIKVTSGHPIYAKRNTNLEWIEAGDLKIGEFVAQPIPQEIIYDKSITEQDAYVYGLMLISGVINNNKASLILDRNNKDIKNNIIKYLKSKNIDFSENKFEESISVTWELDDSIPFSHEDLPNNNLMNNISPRFSNLPIGMTINMLKAIAEYDGLTVATSISFCILNYLLAEDIKYQLLRIGIPCNMQELHIDPIIDPIPNEMSKSLKQKISYYRIDIPAVEEISTIFNIISYSEKTWRRLGNFILHKITNIKNIDPCSEVYDLKVEGMEEYSTNNFLAHNGGKRKGAGCAYLETWHKDIESFLDLRKNTGDDRVRCHDMNTANWIPDEFMKRVKEDLDWYLFSPSDTPDLHESYGQDFSDKYNKYIEMAKSGELSNFEVVSAKTLWKKMLTSLFETGHPWMTFKDPSNIRYSNKHVGTVKSSNLCCVTGDQRVVTENGILTVEELYKLDTENNIQSHKIVGRDGIKTSSRMVLPRPDAPIIKVKTNEGYSHKVTPDHPLWVVGKGWVEAQDLSIGDKIEIQQIEGLFGKEDKIDEAFICGLVTGDGTFSEYSTCIDVWEKDFFICDQIESKVANLISKYNIKLNTSALANPKFNDATILNEGVKKKRLASAPLAQIFLQLGFSKHTKLKVPEFVWRGTRETVSAYLSGLYLADGTTQASEELTTISLASKEESLLLEIQILLANFGIKTSLSKMRDEEIKFMPDGNGGSKEYIVGKLFRLFSTSIRSCSKLEKITKIAEFRKNEQLIKNITKEGYKEKMYATVHSLELLPNEDTYCLKVDSEDHSWTCNGVITKNTEILLHTVPSEYEYGKVTKTGETAVCNLGSLNLINILKESNNDLDKFYIKLKEVTDTAIRMLDNVIDINFYPTEEAKNANTRNRPVGLGIMGFHDCLHELGINYDSEQSVEISGDIQEHISYQAIKSSSVLAKQRGKYQNYEGSLWSQNIFPIDSYNSFMKEYRDSKIEAIGKLDWTEVRESVKENGMRNSNTMAIAPTATISYIQGCSQSIEPDYSILHSYSTLSGDFIMLNEYFVKKAKKLDIWGQPLIDALKKVDGDVYLMDLTEDIKQEFKNSFEMSQMRLIDCAAERQKWIDMGQSLNLYSKITSLKYINDIYMHAWDKGLKTTYYLRSQSMSKVEKSTVDVSVRSENEVQACSIESARLGIACESCQ